MTNTKLKGLFSPLLAKIRIKKSLRFIKNRTKILDVGCDDAKILYKINLKRINYYIGIDTNKKIIEYNKKKWKNKENIKFLSGDIQNLELNKKFDCVVMLALIEHLEKPHEMMNKIKEMLEINGIIIITTPSKFADNILKMGSLLRLFSSESLEEHNIYFNRKKIKKLGKKYNLKLVKFKHFELFMNQLFILKKIKN